MWKSKFRNLTPARWRRGSTASTHGASLHGIDILTHSLISPQAAAAKEAAKAAAEKKAQASKEAAAAKREAAALKASAGQDAQKQKAAAAAEKV